MAYDWKKTLEKVAWNALYVAIAGILMVYANNPWVLMVAPMLSGLQNWIKHRNS